MKGIYSYVPLRAQTRKYHFFEGSNAENMPRLLTGTDEYGVKVYARRRNISPKQLWEARLGRIRGEGDIRELQDHSIDTNMAAIPDPEGGKAYAVRFTLDHPLLYQLPEAPFVGSNLRITPEEYANSKGFALTPEQVADLIYDPYALPDVRRRFWEEGMFEGDVKFTEAVIADVTKKLGLPFPSVMGVIPPANPGLRLVKLMRAEGHRSKRASASGRYAFHAPHGRMVGVAIEHKMRGKRR